VMSNCMRMNERREKKARPPPRTRLEQTNYFLNDEIAAASSSFTSKTV
jgi:hypothetical protein